MSSHSFLIGWLIKVCIFLPTFTLCFINLCSNLLQSTGTFQQLKTILVRSSKKNLFLLMKWNFFCLNMEKAPRWASSIPSVSKYSPDIKSIKKFSMNIYNIGKEWNLALTILFYFLIAYNLKRKWKMPLKWKWLSLMN